MTHAIVLIEAERTALPTLGGTLADVESQTSAKVVILQPGETHST